MVSGFCVLFSVPPHLTLGRPPLPQGNPSVMPAKAGIQKCVRAPCGPAPDLIRGTADWIPGQARDDGQKHEVRHNHQEMITNDKVCLHIRKTVHCTPPGRVQLKPPKPRKARQAQHARWWDYGAVTVQLWWDYSATGAVMERHPGTGFGACCIPGFPCVIGPPRNTGGKPRWH